MTLPTPRQLLASSVVALCAAAISVAGVSADDAANSIDDSKLVKFDDRTYLVDYADWVSTDPLSTARVKKIEAGRVSYVDITTTATGTYSTDGLTSPHVNYPGIEVQEIDATGTRTGNRFAYWSANGWVGFKGRGANSFISYTSTGNVVRW